MCSSLVAKGANTREWYIDSGASAHMTMDVKHLENVRAAANSEIIVGDNSRLQSTCAGDVNISIAADGKQSNAVKVKDVLCIPSICANLMSVSQMAKRGNTLVFDDKSCKIFDSDRTLIGTAPLVDDLYKLDCAVQRPPSALVALDRNLWHRRLGYTSEGNLDNVKSAANGIDFRNVKCDKCVVCIKGKQTRVSFGGSENRAENVLDLVHSDVAFLPAKSFGTHKKIM